MSTLDRIENHLWKTPSPTRREYILRVIVAVLRAITQSRIKLFATALTYNTLLAIVPLLAVLFTLLKSFGIERFLQRLVKDLLAPMGSAGEQVSKYLFEFISNAQAGVLGGVGLLFLFYSIFNLFNKIEIALNHLWFIEKKRNLKNQLLNYLGVMMMAVIIATIALGLNVFVHQGILQNQWQHLPGFAIVVTWLIKSLSVVVTAVMLAVLYSGAINTEVNFRAAFTGGLFCALLWLPLTAGFAQLMSASTSYSVIYSSFAGLVILLIWLNILWLLFLSGGLFSYFIQHPALLQAYGTARLNPTETEYYANLIIQTIVQQFNAGKGETELTELIKVSHLSHRQVLELLSPFLRKKLIIAIDGSQMRFVPGVNPNNLSSEEVTAIIRGKMRNHNHKSSMNTVHNSQ